MNDMKLAEALIKRADLVKRGAQVKERLNSNAKVQEGEEPAQQPLVLLQEFEEIAQEMLELLKRINRTNSMTDFESGKTLTDALAERDVLTSRLKTYRDLVASATVRHDRYTRSEVKFIPAVNIANLQKQVDAMARDYRELDMKIQALNWHTDLIE